MSVYTREFSYIELPLSLVKNEKPNYENNCFSLDFSSHPVILKEGIQQIFFDFKTIENTGVALFVTDKNLFANRDIKFNRRFISGDYIEIEDLGKRIEAFFIYSLSNMKVRDKSKNLF